MFAKLKTAIVIGLDAVPIEVEADISRGLTSFNIVGLGDKAVQESRERVLSSLRNSNLNVPRGKITINLAPAYIPKTGPSFDMPIAIALLFANKSIQFKPNLHFFVGELSLNGQFRRVPGILSIALLAKKEGFENIYVPFDNANEASLVKDINVIPVKSLQELILHFSGQQKITPHKYKAHEAPNLQRNDFKYIKGQLRAKRALEIAAAGGHNILLSGVPGSGKTLLAKSLPSILPPLTFDESIEVTEIYSIANLLNPNTPLIRERPFRSPHHTSSTTSIVGGGRIPKPGEITLAHRGVLFLDEFPEFSSLVLESLRQPLENQIISISRTLSSAVFPANFILVAAMNPCKCGYFGDKDKECTCSMKDIINYQKKISGPIMDRLDLQVKVTKVPIDELEQNSLAEASDRIIQRVIHARNMQRARYQEFKSVSTNSDLSQKELRKFCHLDQSSQLLLRKATNHFNLSARSYFKIIKTSRTIADLDNSNSIRKTHIAEAISYRFEKN